MEWSEVDSKDEWVRIPSNWLFLLYYEAISILFRVENALRTLVYVVLKNDRMLEWVETSIESDDANQTTIAALAKKRIAQSQKYGYLGYNINSPLMYLTSGELVRLLIADANWNLFKKYFNASKQVVTLKLEEIGIIRNSLAHFRPLTQNDVEVVKQNANQVLSVIEKTLNNLTKVGQRVPTNTTDNWYINLRSLGGNHTQVIHNQSIDKQWIHIILKFDCSIIRFTPQEPRTYIRYSLLNINSVGILNINNNLRKFITCVSEDVPYVPITPDFLPKFRKNIDLIFSRDIIQKHHEEIKSEIENLLGKIDNEAELIRDDNLAKGEVVMVDTLTIRRESSEEKYWTIPIDKLLIPLSENDPAEYWGSFDMFGEDFISDIDRFPWMPVSVSKKIFVF